MTSPKFDFAFDPEGFTSTQGAIIPAEEFFRGTDAQSSVARETIQNSLDAVDVDTRTVRVEFEMQVVRTDEIPGIDSLRRAIEAAARDGKDGQGSGRLAAALARANSKTMHVLRIGDYNTTGLTGTESKDDRTSPLSALTRGTGVSSSDGHRGGSFGIGSAVGPMASEMSTVLYLSQTKNAPGNVFAGYSRLASHRDPEGIWRTGEGFYRNIQRTDDFEYLRGWTPFPPFKQRVEPGTDVFILGYWKADEDRGLYQLRDAIVENFMVALMEGNLSVRGVTPHGDWILDSETIDNEIRQSETLRSKVLPFYRAMTDNDSIVANLAGFGRVRLYINDDSSLEKKLGTWTMRQPLMKVDTFNHIIPHPYAAVLICEGDEANKRLRDLEPPQHNKWDGDRARAGKAYLTKLKAWVREQLRQRLAVPAGAKVKVQGLERFLPEFDGSGGTDETEIGRPKPKPESETSTESATKSGATTKSESAKKGMTPSVRVRVHRPAVGGGDQAGTKGKDAGGKSKRKNKGGGLSGKGSQSETGSGRIPSEQLSMHAWFDATTGSQHLALECSEQLRGDIELRALGPQGGPIDGYSLEITEAERLVDGQWVTVKHTANSLKDVALSEDSVNRLKFTTASRQRLRIGVANG